jgi:hypothetical protein
MTATGEDRTGQDRTYDKGMCGKISYSSHLNRRDQDEEKKWNTNNQPNTAREIYESSTNFVPCVA